MIDCHSIVSRYSMVSIARFSMVSTALQTTRSSARCWNVLHKQQRRALTHLSSPPCTLLRFCVGYASVRARRYADMQHVPHMPSTDNDITMRYRRTKVSSIFNSIILSLLVDFRDYASARMGCSLHQWVLNNADTLLCRGCVAWLERLRCVCSAGP